MSLVDPPPPSQPSNPDETRAERRYQAGDVIDGKYRLVRPLGEGGMGVVWVARHTVVDVDVAIKLIPLRPEIDRSALAGRLLQEVRTAVRVAHPSICRILDFGETHLGDPFVVSELLHGAPLADVLGREPRMPAVRAVQLLLPIADALALAHARGIVHRDVKPENIFLARDVVGRIEPKLLDFGIAHFTDGDGPTAQERTLLGTPDYMSPEQARGAATSPRTDVWSLSIVLYRAITGNTPFSADDPNGVLRNVLNREPLPTTASAAGDEALWLIIQRGLCKEPTDRWASMRELGEAWARWLHDHGVREDLSGASLTATWLESSWEGTSHDFETEFLASELEDTPVSGVSRSGFRSRPASLPSPLLRPESPDEPPGRGSPSTIPAPPLRRRTRLAFFVGLCLVAVALGLVLALRSPGHTPSASVQCPGSAPSAAIADTECPEGSPGGVNQRCVPSTAPSR
jgi:eukaryotic-like serine/threonine-protein kinase